MGKIKKLMGWLAGAVIAIGAAIAYLLGPRSQRNDRPGNNRRIAKQFDSARGSIKRERKQVERERKQVERERAEIDGERKQIERDRSLLSELKRRRKK